MAGHYAARTQRVDLLDYLGQKTRNEGAACRESVFRAPRGNAPTVLLGRLPASLQIINLFTFLFVYKKTASPQRTTRGLLTLVGYVLSDWTRQADTGKN